MADKTMCRYPSPPSPCVGILLCQKNTRGLWPPITSATYNPVCNEAKAPATKKDVEQAAYGTRVYRSKRVANGWGNAMEHRLELRLGKPGVHSPFHSLRPASLPPSLTFVVDRSLWARSASFATNSAHATYAGAAGLTAMLLR